MLARLASSLRHARRPHSASSGAVVAASAWLAAACVPDLAAKDDATTTVAGGGGSSTGGDATTGGGAGGAGGAGGTPDPSACGDVPCPYATPQSCSGEGIGVDACGTVKPESCCTSLYVPGGSFKRRYDGVNNNVYGGWDLTDPSYLATVSGFYLDKYEVTVGRFRRFVKAVTADGWRPAAGSGKHTHLRAGMGLKDSGGPGYESGWDASWVGQLPTTKEGWDTVLVGCKDPAFFLPWTKEPGPYEAHPVSCVSWYQAYAFCIWDGGFLPTDAERMFVASGGDEQRVFPWSVPPASGAIDASRAVWCGDSCNTTQAVGSRPLGSGRWGHLDLGGNISEYELDWSSRPYFEKECDDCARLSGSGKRFVVGGAAIHYSSFYLLSAYNDGALLPSAAQSLIGLRCARAPTSPK